MPSVTLERSRKKRLEHAHPWIFNNEIASVDGNPEPGDIVNVLNHQGRYLATGYYNPASQITVRVVSYQPLEFEQMDTAFLRLVSMIVCVTGNASFRMAKPTVLFMVKLISYLD